METSPTVTNVIPTDKPAPSETATVLAIVERCAINPEVNVDKMQTLLDMQERILDRSARQAFSADFVRMKPEIPKVLKTKSNLQTKSRYATLDDVNRTVDPVLEKFGFGSSFKIAQSDTHITATATLWHVSGHTEETTVCLPLDKTGIQGSVNKTEVHAIGSSITYAKRYAICALLNISTGDEDDDGNAAGNNAAVDVLATLPQQQVITGLVARLTPISKARFASLYPKISEIKKSEVDSVIARLKRTLGEIEVTRA
jgi:hypothetical protein